MDEQSVSVNSKIDYVKPVILDLGAVTAAYGAAGCAATGGTATLECETGGTAGTNCVSGNTAESGGCTGGTSPVT